MPSLLSFDRITAADIEAWCVAKVHETDQVEFKAKYDSSSFRREWCKDVSAMANTMGGIVAIGVEEKNGTAERVNPISDADALIGRLQSTLDANLRPRLGVKIRRVPMDSGGDCVLIAVPASKYGPHMTCADDDRRFYKRTAHGASIMDTDELRKGFLSSNTAEEIAIVRHREHRRSLGSLLPDHAAILLDSIAVAAEDRFDPASDAERERIRSLGNSIWNSHQSRITFDGYLLYTEQEGHKSEVRVLRTGTVLSHTQQTFGRAWSGDQARKIIPHIWFPEQLNSALRSIMQIQSGIIVNSPRVLCLTVAGIRGWRLTPPHWTSDAQVIETDVLEFPPLVFDGSAANWSPFVVVEPWLHRLWQASGFARCHLYSGPNGEPDWQAFCRR